MCLQKAAQACLSDARAFFRTLTQIFTHIVETSQNMPKSLFNQFIHVHAKRIVRKHCQSS